MIAAKNVGVSILSKKPKKPLILPNKRRRCIFTHLPANKSIIMGPYPDKHSQLKKVTTCSLYLAFRNEKMDWKLEKREKEIFNLYWKLELEMVFGNVNQIDFSELKKLQGENLEEMRKLNGDFDIDSHIAKVTEDFLDGLDLNDDSFGLENVNKNK